MKPRSPRGRGAGAASRSDAAEAELVFDRLWQVSLSVFVPSEDVPVVFKSSSQVLAAMSKETQTYISPVRCMKFHGFNSANQHALALTFAAVI